MFLYEDCRGLRFEPSAHVLEHLERIKFCLIMKLIRFCGVIKQGLTLVSGLINQDCYEKWLTDMQRLQEQSWRGHLYY